MFGLAEDTTTSRFTRVNYAAKEYNISAETIVATVRKEFATREAEEDRQTGSGITFGLREQAHFLCAGLPDPERCSHRV